MTLTPKLKQNSHENLATEIYLLQFWRIKKDEETEVYTKGLSSNCRFQNYLNLNAPLTVGCQLKFWPNQVSQVVSACGLSY
jgi:hypothetical protein